jgi:phytoene dehydrogenase-like protein
MQTTFDLIIIGGGLSGLASAIYAARAGLSVKLLEKASHPGGRAISTQNNGATFNIGPHALYRGGFAEKTLRDLGVTFRGKIPGAGSYALFHHELHPLPGASLFSFLGNSFFSARQTLTIAKALLGLRDQEIARWQQQPFAQWLDHVSSDEKVRKFLAALGRVSNYCTAAQEQLASDTLAQIKLALINGVLYLDSGWQSLVDQLSQLASRQGTQLQAEARVASINEETHQVTLSSGELLRAKSVLLAVPPKEALSLLPNAAKSELQEKLDDSLPIQAACLDVALSTLSKPAHQIVLGFDDPLYYSVHSGFAKLAPDGVAVLHVAKYLQANEDTKQNEQQLEGFLELIQPNWRSHLLHKRFLPQMTVTHWMAQTKTQGLAGRPATSLHSAPGVFLAGDWVGSQGMLADGALASAAKASQEAIIWCKR